MKIHQSGEDYLETILILQNRKGSVRSIDIANELGYSKPSISRAMGILREEELIEMGSDGNILFTEKGRKKALEVYERHNYITKYLMLTLNLEEKLASEDACRIEHIISQETFDKIKDFVEFNGSK
ncbi:metal-dependent transcriptional regulator [Clostridium cellulovorans]|uniref:Iron (Metal) dependent repressor, DtxR family n=1 Tax=Clostridium cellulovorans (strain ATCC 35296 / DSM 3052 / OCM 3 / 743B) TaxID=573061 RepID=D9SN08_CLOC7|nr:metal-dependent transcriptional regulator [Clostridium cellulovorans]ADL51874.1 iron (metal) dependent repressor, DtxR family [Clostridium cellulovorans 743B]